MQAYRAYLTFNFLGQILTLLGYLEINLDIFWSDSRLTERYRSHLSGENLGLLVKLEMKFDLFLPGSDASFKLTKLIFSVRFGLDSNILERF